MSKVKKIYLTKGQVTFVDERDYATLNRHSWRADKRKDTWYAARTIGSGKSKTTIYMHRIILGVSGKQVVVDHKDGDGLNNRRDNLRKCTHAQNIANRRSTDNSSSKYLGVYFENNSRMWIAALYKGKRHYLGKFSNEKDAAMAYNKAALVFHGVFARLNKV